MPSIRRRGGQIVDEGLDIIPETELQPVGLANGMPAEGEAAPDLLSAPVGMDDDLSHALAARPQRTKLPGLTAVLVAAVLVAGGFLAGVLTQKHQAGSSSGANANAFAAFRNRTGAGTGGTGTGAAGTGGTGFGATAGGAGGAASTVGTVKLVDGNTIYLTATDGSIVKVTTNAGTTIKVSKPGKPADLAPGSTVIVVGKAGADGVVKATTVTQGGTGGGGFGAGRTRTGTGTGAGTGTGTGGSGAPAGGSGG